MRVAVIDLGTNTFNLVIADVTAERCIIVHNSKIGVALGAGGMADNKIMPEAIKRAHEAFATFIPLCHANKAEKIIGIGTSAIRGATNGQAFIDDLANNYQVELKIIDGQQEAAYIFQGVSWTSGLKDDYLIMDIGGGSTEFIAVNDAQLTHACSLDIGLLRPVQAFALEDPLSTQNCQDIVAWFESQSEPLAAFPKRTTLMGASGSFETIYEMIHSQPFPKGLTAVALEMSAFQREIDWLIASTQVERDQHDWIIPIRRQLAPIAALKLKWIIEKMNITEVFVSPCSLKEGVLRTLSEK